MKLLIEEDYEEDWEEEEQEQETEQCNLMMDKNLDTSSLPVKDNASPTIATSLFSSLSLSSENAEIRSTTGHHRHSHVDKQDVRNKSSQPSSLFHLFFHLFFIFFDLFHQSLGQFNSNLIPCQDDGVSQMDSLNLNIIIHTPRRLREVREELMLSDSPIIVPPSSPMLFTVKMMV